MGFMKAAPDMGSSSGRNHSPVPSRITPDCPKEALTNTGLIDIMKTTRHLPAGTGAALGKTGRAGGMRDSGNEVRSDSYKEGSAGYFQGSFLDSG
jgi:hypothetical protein